MTETKATRWDQRTKVAAVVVAGAAVLAVITLVQRNAGTQTISGTNQSGSITAHTANANQPVAPAPRHLTDDTIAQLKTVARDAVVVVATAGDTRETASYANEITAWLLANNYSNVTTQREDDFPRFFGEKIGPEEGEYRITIGDQRP